ncbi:hypothetical protein F4776DRAFT_658718 [Hypoxylon sp. NC0597]|nr:hypothetical protein F4776DRAFT_658718 [Hypoxylon sp. NC0597]
MSLIHTERTVATNRKFYLHVRIGALGGKERVVKIISSHSLTLVFRDHRDIYSQHLYLTSRLRLLVLTLSRQKYTASFKMSSSSNPPRRARVNSLISLMCELEGIPAPGPDAYTTEPPEPLTKKEVGWIKKLIKERERGQSTSNDRASLSADHGDGNSTATQRPVANPWLLPRILRAKSSDQGFVCPTCRMGFKTDQTLATHTREVHIGTRCFWPGCSIKCRNEGLLNRHLQRHNADLPDGYRTCNWPGCKRGYRSSQSLNRHLRKHQISARRASEARTS